MKAAAPDVLDAVEKYYDASAVVVREVANATGFGATRRIDALALGCWPSRGLFVHAIEVKVSRSDFRRELKKPKKAETIAKYCDTFWIAAPKDVVPLDELPNGWGLLELKDGAKKVRVKKKAASLELVELSRGFVMSICRSLVDQKDLRRQLSFQKLQLQGAAAREAEKNAEKRWSDRVTKLQKELSDLRDIKQALGGTAPHEVAELLRTYRRLTPARIAPIRRMVDSFSQSVRELEEAIEEMGSED